MSLIKTYLQDIRANHPSNNDRDEIRTTRTGLLTAAMSMTTSQNSVISPDLIAKAKESEGRVLDVPVMKKGTVTIENTRSCTIGGGQLNPSVIVAATNVSNAAIAQNASIEAAFRRNFASAIMAQFEKNLLGAADATGPTSIFADGVAATATWTDALALARIQEMYNTMITKGNDVNKSSVKLLLNGDAYADLAAQIAAKDGSPFNAAAMNLVDRTVLNIPYAISANVGNGSNDTRARALMLDMEKVHLAMFGGLDMLVDPYSQSLLGGTRLVMSTLLDGLIAQSSGKEAAVKCVAAA